MSAQVSRHCPLIGAQGGDNFHATPILPFRREATYEEACEVVLLIPG